MNTSAISPESLAHTPAEEVMIRIRSLLGPSGAAVEPDTAMASLPIDSIDFVYLLCGLHEELSVRLTEADLRSVVTVGEFADLIARKLPETES